MFVRFRSDIVFSGPIASRPVDLVLIKNLLMFWQRQDIRTQKSFETVLMQRMYEETGDQYFMLS